MTGFIDPSDWRVTGNEYFRNLNVFASHGEQSCVFRPCVPRPTESAVFGWVCLRSRWVLRATCKVSSTRFGHFRVCHVLAPPFARLLLTSHFGLFLFMFLLTPSKLGSTAPPQRAVGWDNHAGGLGDHAVSSRRCPGSVRRHNCFLVCPGTLVVHEKILEKCRFGFFMRVPILYTP